MLCESACAKETLTIQQLKINNVKQVINICAYAGEVPASLLKVKNFQERMQKILLQEITRSREL